MGLVISMIYRIIAYQFERLVGQFKRLGRR